MTKHKYAELFTAKLNNTELVLFEKHFDWDEWRESGADVREESKIFFVSDNFEYFLCLPQHKEACLHWLNGGECEIDTAWHGFEAFSEEMVWSKFSSFMGRGKIRIKPRKEKFWIAIDVKNGDVCLCTENSKPAPNYQVVEIEVEI